jgi:hypothetical protein
MACLSYLFNWTLTLPGLFGKLVWTLPAAAQSCFDAPPHPAFETRLAGYYTRSAVGSELHELVRVLAGLANARHLCI